VCASGRLRLAVLVRRAQAHHEHARCPVAAVIAPAVALDADVRIAFLAASDAQHGTAVAHLRRRLAAGAQLLLAATVYAEVLVRPLQRRDDDIVDVFIAALNATIVPLDRDIASRAARLCGA
jgi:hypothetical protein